MLHHLHLLPPLPPPHSVSCGRYTTSIYFSQTSPNSPCLLCQLYTSGGPRPRRGGGGGGLLDELRLHLARRGAALRLPFLRRLAAGRGAPGPADHAGAVLLDLHVVLVGVLRGHDLARGEVEAAPLHFLLDGRQPVQHRAHHGDLPQHTLHTVTVEVERERERELELENFILQGL